MSEIQTQIEEVEVQGNLYGFDVTVPYEGQVVDNGIGPYEFWGSRGTDVRMETEIDWKVEDIEIDAVKDDDDKDVKGNFDPEILKAALMNFFDGGENSRWWEEAITRQCEDDFED